MGAVPLLVLGEVAAHAQHGCLDVVPDDAHDAHQQLHRERVSVRECVCERESVRECVWESVCV